MDERFNRTLLQLLRAHSMNGKLIYHMSCMPTELPSILQQVFPIYATVWQATNARPNGNTTGV